MTASTSTSSPTPASGLGTCPGDLSYLANHANPAFGRTCSVGVLPVAAMTCFQPVTVFGVTCPGDYIIISDAACPAATENEAANSWFEAAALSPATGRIQEGQSDGHGHTWDPYGSC